MVIGSWAEAESSHASTAHISLPGYMPDIPHPTTLMFKRFAYPVVTGLLAYLVFPHNSSIADFSQVGYIFVAILYLAALVGVLSSTYASGEFQALRAKHAKSSDELSQDSSSDFLSGIRTLAFLAAMVTGARLAFWMPLLGTVLCGTFVSAVTLYWRHKMRESGLERTDADLVGYQMAAQSGLNWGLPALLVSTLVAFH